MKKELTHIIKHYKTLTLLYIVLLYIIIGLPATAESRAVQNRYGFIKSANLTQFNRIISGFKESFPNASVVEMDLKRKNDEDAIRAFVLKYRPSIIICLGAIAATTTAKVEKRIPILFSMVLNYRRYGLLKSPNVTGIKMEIPASSLFTQFRILFPTLTSVGVPYNPRVSSEIIRDAKISAKKMGITLYPIKVEDPDDMEDLLNDHSQNFNGLWMISDPVLYNRRSSAYIDLMKFSNDNRKPLLTPTEPFVKAGSFFSVSINYTSLGSQLALISKRITVDKISPGKIPIAPPIGTFTVINKESAQKIMGNAYDEAILEEVDKVYPEENE